jgi:uncharacterized phage protein gp47/JayE
MGGFEEDGYEARSVEELMESYRDSIDQEYEDEVEDYEGSFAQALFMAFSRAVSTNQEADLEQLYDSLFIVSAEDDELTKLARGYGVDRQAAIPATGVVEWTRNSTGSEEVIPEGTTVKTEGPNAIEYFTTESGTFGTNETTIRTNIKAAEAGTVGNVGAGRVTEMPTPPASVVAVTNPFPVGDPDFDLTNGQAQTLGQDEERDSELRERVLEGGSIGGSATVRAVRDSVRSIEGTPSLTVNTNRKLTDNGSGYGLPPLATELVIHAPSATDDEIAQAIHDVIAVTERLESGYNGAAQSYVITDTILNSDRTIEWSKPNEVDLNITIDVVTDDGFAGENAVKESIAEYIGGTLPDGSPAPGLDVSEDVIVNQLEQNVVTVEGVIGTSSLKIDGDGDGSDDITTRGDGLEVYDVANNEVAIIDSTNNITVNTQ